MTNFDDVFAIIRELELAVQRLPDAALRFEMHNCLNKITAMIERIQTEESNGAGIEVVVERIDEVNDFLDQLNCYLELYR
jgi:hypothetical protein